jgi:hypothetical protein
MAVGHHGVCSARVLEPAVLASEADSGHVRIRPPNLRVNSARAATETKTAVLRETTVQVCINIVNYPTLVLRGILVHTMAK